MTDAAPSSAGEPPERRDATATPSTVHATAEVPTPTITLSTRLWWHWLDIATAQAVVAEASQGLVDLAPEIQSSLVAITSAAFCIDGLYAEVQVLRPVGQATRGAWKQNSTPRWRRVAHTILQGFNVDHPTRARIRTELEWLYDARDMGVHHEEKPRSPEPHPTRTGSVSAENARYSAPNAQRAAQLVFDLLEACAVGRHPSGPAWATPRLQAAAVFRQRLGP